MSYQGSLLTSGGVPVADGSYSVVFTLYSVPAGGSVIWTETKSVTTVGGQFSVLLGSATALTDLVFADTIRYLGIKVDTDPELTPRTRLATSPYAFRVSTIDSARGGVLRGNLVLETSSGSAGNVYKGGNLFLHTFGTYNTFLGDSAGNLTTSGQGENTGVGRAVFPALTTGVYNSAVGSGALRSLTTGNSNVAIGREALALNSTSGSNTAIGVSALGSGLTGIRNTAIGLAALQANAADSNVGVGYRALQSNTVGFHNTALGTSAMESSVLGYENTAIGFRSLANFSDTMGQHTAVGALALQSQTSGFRNTAVGASALLSTTSGGYNTAIGSRAIASNTSGSGNTAVGESALSFNTTGTNNSALGNGANVSSGNLTNATAIGFGAVANASNKIRLGNASVTTLECQVALTVASDRNAKENFRPVDTRETLQRLLGLGVTSWNYKGHDSSRFRHIGPMAQEFFAAFGHDSVGQMGDSVTINSGDLSGVMIVAIQQLAKEKDDMQRENAELRDRLERLELAVRQLAASAGRPYQPEYSRR